ncbi:hypothetical protein ANCDUO_24143, partial [Ancylostoma duodenale]
RRRHGYVRGCLSDIHGYNHSLVRALGEHPGCLEITLIRRSYIYLKHDSATALHADGAETRARAVAAGDLRMSHEPLQLGASVAAPDILVRGGRGRRRPPPLHYHDLIAITGVVASLRNCMFPMFCLTVQAFLEFCALFWKIP